MFKKLGMLCSVAVLGGILALGAAQEVAVEAEPSAPAVAVSPALPPPIQIDYRMAGGLLASILGGTGLTWAAKRKMKKKRKAVNMGLSGLFTAMSGVGTMKMMGMGWKESLITVAMGWGASQAPYQAHKRRNPPAVTG